MQRIILKPIIIPRQQSFYLPSKSINVLQQHPDALSLPIASLLQHLPETPNPFFTTIIILRGGIFLLSCGFHTFCSTATKSFNTQRVH